jgi:hypothetical protein
MECTQLTLFLGIQTVLAVLCCVRDRYRWPHCVLLAHCSCVLVLPSTTPVLIEVHSQPRRVSLRPNLLHTSQHVLRRNKPTRRVRRPSGGGEDVRVDKKCGSYQRRYAHNLVM